MEALVHQNGEREAENHEERTKEDGALFEYFRSLCAKSLVGHMSTKGGTETLLLGALHQDDEEEEGADNKQHRENNVDRGVKHKD